MKSKRKRLRDNLDKVFSEFIRLRDSDSNGMVRCCTCEKPHHWQEVDNGHGITRGDYSTRWEEHNCMAQCKRCNLRGGEQFIFSQEVDRRFGKGEWDRLMQKRHEIFKVPLDWYQEKIDYYKEEVKKLKEAKNL